MTDMSSALAYRAAANIAAADKARMDEPASREAKAMKQAQQFESMFLSTYLKTMFQEVGNDPTLIGGTGSDSWKELLIDEYGKSFAARGGIGLAEPIAHQLIKMQEASQP